MIVIWRYQQKSIKSTGLFYPIHFRKMTKKGLFERKNKNGLVYNRLIGNNVVRFARKGINWLSDAMVGYFLSKFGRRIDAKQER